MTGCPTAVQLADLEHGRGEPQALERLEGHVAGCDECKRARAAVRAAHAAFARVEAMGAPELGVGMARGEATARWARAQSEPRPGLRPPFVFALAGAMVAGVVGWGLSQGPTPAVTTTSRPVLVAERPAPPSTHLDLVVTLVSGVVQLERAAAKQPLGLDTVIVASDHALCAPGARVGAQWGEASGLLLVGGTLGFDRLERGAERLALEHGKVFVRVGPHEPGESLEVSTPTHRVRVHGTWFTVAADQSRTTVEVMEGVVEVTDLATGVSTLLSAPSRGVFGRGRATSGALDAAHVGELRSEGESGLLAWEGADMLRRSTGPLAIISDPPGDIAVDGVRLGPAPLAVRRPTGRHYAEIGRAGFTPLKRWVEVGPETEPLHLALPRAAERSEPVEIEAMVHDRASQIRSCYERRLKRDPGLAGTVSLRVRVGGAGQVTQVAVEESTLADPLVGECLRREASGWSFHTGRNATVVYPFVFRPQ